MEDTKKMSIEEAQAQVDELTTTLARDRIKQITGLVQGNEAHKQQFENQRIILSLLNRVEAKVKAVMEENETLERIAERLKYAANCDCEQYVKCGEVIEAARDGHTIDGYRQARKGFRASWHRLAGIIMDNDAYDGNVSPHHFPKTAAEAGN